MRKSSSEAEMPRGLKVAQKHPVKPLQKTVNGRNGPEYTFIPETRKAKQGGAEALTRACVSGWQTKEDQTVMLKKLLAKAEELEWNYYEDENGGVELEKYSPAGEDFIFYVHDKKRLVEATREYADDFDVDEHIEMWVSARHSVSGVPNIRTLVEDAEAIKAMLKELADALREVAA